MFYLGEIIGLKVTDIRGFEHTGRPKPPAKHGTRGHYDAQYILFDDGKTIIELEEQDPYTYHDASHLARLIHVRQDKGFWEKIKSDLNYYPLANWIRGINMDFKVGDRVRIKGESGAGPGGYAYTRIGSEGVIQNVDTLTRIATIKFYKLTGGFQPIPYDNRIYGIVVADIELLQPRSNYRRIEL